MSDAAYFNPVFAEITNFMYLVISWESHSAGK